MKSYDQMYDTRPLGYCHAGGSENISVQIYDTYLPTARYRKYTVYWMIRVRRAPGTAEHPFASYFSPSPSRSHLYTS
jgi:hypothetical protein